ncbi:MAG: hypothetical protein LBH35_04140, partial [Treponema sp.]|nr:hypothetical protein [Treponema sp.]
MNWFFLFLAAVILSWLIALLYLKSYIKRRTGAGYMLRELREEIRLLEAEIDAKTDQHLALLEEKIGELRQLCTEAEKRVAVYTRELNRKIAEEAAFAALDRNARLPEPPRETAAPKSPGRRTSGKAGRVGKKTAGRGKERSLLDSIEVREATAARAAGAYRIQARRPGPEEVPAKGGVPEGDGVSESGGPRFTVSANPIRAKAPPLKERVAELYRAGFSEDFVAARLGISVTEARLYIAMASEGRQ